MTIQSLYTLFLLRTVQKKEQFSVKMYAIPSLLETNGCSARQQVRRKIEKTASMIECCLPYLEEKGFLRIDRTDGDGSFCDILQLTHRGFHFLQISLHDLLILFLKSVLLPIVVAFATTLVTIWLKERYGIELPVS